MTRLFDTLIVVQNVYMPNLVHSLLTLSTSDDCFDSIIVRIITYACQKRVSCVLNLFSCYFSEKDYFSSRTSHVVIFSELLTQSITCQKSPFCVMNAACCTVCSLFCHRVCLLVCLIIRTWASYVLFCNFVLYVWLVFPC